MKISKSSVGDTIFLACGEQNEIIKFLSTARNKIALDLELIDDQQFAFCWIVDYPMFERNQVTKKLNSVIILFQCLKVI